MINNGNLKFSFKIFALLLVTASWSSMAFDTACLKQAQKEKKALECLELESAQIKANATHQGSKGILKAYGAFVTLERNTTTEDGDQLHILAGEQTQLEGSIASFWDEDEKEVFILNEKGDILVFTDFLFGDVAPKRIVKNKDIPGATDLALGSDHLVVLNSTTQRLLFIRKDANSRALPDNRHDHVSKTWDLPQNHSFVAISAKNDDEVFVLEDNGNLYKITKLGKSILGKVEGASDLTYFSDESGAALKVLTSKGPIEIQLK